MSKSLPENRLNPIIRLPKSPGVRSSAHAVRRHSAGPPRDNCGHPGKPMEQRATICLVDGNSRRRAAIFHDLAGMGCHVEPFEGADELIRSRPNPGVLLVSDEDEAIATLSNHLATSGTWFSIIAFSERPETPRVVQAMLAGASDYIAWPVNGEVLAERIQNADGTKTKIASDKLREGAACSQIDRLTKREREVLACVASGMSSRAIGEKLRISVRTAEVHRANILKKIGASNTPDATRIALQAKLID